MLVIRLLLFFLKCKRMIWEITLRSLFVCMNRAFFSLSAHETRFFYRKSVTIKKWIVVIWTSIATTITLYPLHRSCCFCCIAMELFDLAEIPFICLLFIEEKNARAHFTLLFSPKITSLFECFPFPLEETWNWIEKPLKKMLFALLFL